MLVAKAPSRFLTQAIALDFLNALDPEEARFDKDSLLRWLRERELVPPQALDGIRQKAEVGELEAATAQAKVLSDWFRDLVREFMGRPLPVSAAH
jgi:hypothetical protein